MSKNRKHKNTLGKFQAFLKIFQINNALYISIIFSIIGIGSLILNIIEKKNISLSVIISVISLLSAVGSLAFKYFEYRREEKNLYSIDDYTYKNLAIQKIEKQYEVAQLGYSLHYIPSIDEYYLNSKDVDEYLRANNCVIRLIKKKEKYVLPVELAPFVPFALKEKLNSGRIFYNGKKVRLMSELKTGIHEVKIQETDYFSTFCTNDLVYKKIRSRRSLNKRFYGHHLLFNDYDALNLLDEGSLSNNIGLSTLAITSDGYIIIGLQGNKNNIGANKYVPTASGSGDYNDTKNKDTLHELLIFGMEREFKEEYNLPSKIKIETRVVGYIRLLKRGGKPDFFGMSTIDLTKDEILQYFKNGREYKKGVMCEPVFIKCNNDPKSAATQIEALGNITIQLYYYLNHYLK